MGLKMWDRAGFLRVLVINALTNSSDESDLAQATACADRGIAAMASFSVGSTDSFGALLAVARNIDDPDNVDFMEGIEGQRFLQDVNRVVSERMRVLRGDS